MAQVFSQRAVLLIKLSLSAVPALAASVVAVYRWNASMPAARGAAVRQPIPFSHKHHVGDDGIDCRYCHTSVENSRFAGMPSTETCMTCHSQLFNDAPVLAPLRESLLSGWPVAWRRVHDLPDFVYFDHSIHVRKGVSCGECHGPVEQMPLIWREASLEMQWCLDCHRRPERHLHPAGEVFRGVRPAEGDARAALEGSPRLLSTRRLTDCSTCHR
ncbi:MAG TPA: cytochrome c3 family protein [Aromatoleum sp.]|uniref:cytochrome c3 family protein n=1 Tax=Aromatoleum sp. TaxID=2307007 RepID=UPI002B475E30|nr:cytochrome c3 family protein [Aromatoleum sp.]HJV24872.1 cytochrome c3 family protein [Aromatoleum sp.]